MPIGTVTLSLLDDKSMPAEILEQFRMKVEQVLLGEHGKRLVRQLEGCTELKWTIVQSPRPQGTQAPSNREILAAQAQRRKENDAWMAERKARRAQAAQQAEAAGRTEDRIAAAAEAMA